MDPYPAIEDHGLIGDLQTAALVATDGTIDWFCAPRFDSPSVFAALLDHRNGGHFRIAPYGVEYVTRQPYLPGTPILITRFMSPAGVGEVVDLMPIAGDRATERHRIVRMVRVVRGEMRFQLDCEPRFNFGRDRAEVEVTGDGATFRSPTSTMNVSAARRDRRLVRAEDIQRTEHGVRVFATLVAGDVGGVVLETAPDGPVRVLSPQDVVELFDKTRDFWRTWIGRSRYRGRWREMVERSAMTLKLMTYAPTGALVAAPTAGLPEQVGGERNWDYRFTWIRDASILYMPLVDFIAPTDPRWQSTLRAIDEELVSDSLVYRYDPAASPDGLRGSEGTFTICSFWYVDALARSGRLDDARLTFEKMLTYDNHLGLYSEEIAPTGEQIGNFPQAFSHLALISAAMNLDYQLDHGAGFVEPVLASGAAVRGG